jgi:hypothetical protein
MKEPKKLKRAVIKEELVELTNDTITAIILNQFIYWAERVSDFDKFISEEAERAKSENKDVGIQHQNGWIYKKATELAEECMLKMSEVAIRTHIKKLVDLQILKERRNPLYKWDKTLQYRLDMQELIKRLNSLGYTLEGYRIQENLASKQRNLASKQENLVSEQRNFASELKNLGAIPETTSETTIEITNKEKEKINKKEKPTEIEAVPTEIDDLLSFYNQLFQKSVRSTKGFEQNYWHWRQFHTIGKIEQALVNARKDKFWRDKMTLTILFRKKNQNGESVDYIEDLSSRVAVKQGQVVAI